MPLDGISSVQRPIYGVDGRLTTQTFQVTYHDIQNATKGCKHYARNCQVRAMCCRKFYTCRLCHDEEEEHEMDRFATQYMLCLFCGLTQPVTQRCVNLRCCQLMAVHFCPVCKLFDNDSTKNIYHCKKCGICRKGQGLGIDYYHCDGCNACLALNLRGTHKCISESTKKDCAVCMEYMFTSRDEVMFMGCGHSIHRKCYNDLTVSSYRCPECQKSLDNKDVHFARMERYNAENRRPESYYGQLAQIHCNDCSTKHSVPRLFYHKCPACQSYNTEVLKIIQSTAR